jgi:hypothetical protein
MKKHWIFLLCLLMTPATALFGQEILPRIRIYNTRLIRYAEPFKVKGAFYALNDSSVLIAESLNAEKILSGEARISEHAIPEIEWIEVKRKNGVVRNGLIGAGAGFAAGYLAGFAAGDDFSAGITGLLGGAFVGLFGGIIGMVGGSRSKIHIQGNREAFQKNRKRLEKYTIQKRTEIASDYK